MNSHLGVHDQNSVMADAKSKNNICTEGHLKNDNHPHPTLKKIHFTNYNFVLYFLQLKHYVYFALVLTDHIKAPLPHLVRGSASTKYFLQGVQSETIWVRAKMPKCLQMKEPLWTT